MQATLIEGQNAYAERLCFGYIKIHVIQVDGQNILIKYIIMS